MLSLGFGPSHSRECNILLALCAYLADMKRFYFQVQLTDGRVLETRIEAATGREATAAMRERHPGCTILAGPVQVGR